jgi:DNA ligase-1
LRGDEAEMERIGGELPARAKKSASKKDGPPLLLAQTWDNATDLADWWMSEKLDGVRAYWDGKRFLSRQGNEYHAPDWFTEGLPDTPLDGELWIDRKAFQRTVSIVRRQDKSEHWRGVRYLVFDAPQRDGGFEDRLAYLGDCLQANKQPYAMLHEHVRCTGIPHLKKELARVESLAGEGLMLREPGSAYEVGRSMTLLKVKTFHDAEAVVLAHQPGKGKHKGKLGAVVAQLEDGTEFAVGTGFSDAQRVSPPPVGSVITFRYQELSNAGVPRFPSFVRVRKAGPAETAAKPTKKKAVKAAKPVKATKLAGESAKRYFELVDGKSSKFWEISVDGEDVTVRYGRIGSDGATKVKTLSDADAAAAHAEKLIGEKTRKGYAES